MKWGQRMVILLIRGYQLGISPWLPPSCRFYPTCSSYTREAVLRFGACRGLWLGLKRICRCHPFHPGGYDPVPDPPTAENGKPPAPPDHG